MDKKRQQVTLALQVLSQHPLVKAKKITPGEIKDWIIGTHKVDPERLVWHAKRTYKIGGSEIFSAVAFLRAVKNAAQDNHESAFVMQSVQDVVSGKILTRTPSEPDSHMRRGILSEPLAREVYLSDLRKQGRKVFHDKEASEALRKFRSEEYPWLAYNEDDVLIIDGVRTLIDYKCPAPDPVKGLDLKVEEAYVHQLHLGAYCLEQCGFPVEKLKLVKYNVVEATALEIPVSIKRTLIEENLEAGTYLYENYILKRRIPEYQPQMLPAKSLLDISNELKTMYGHIDGAPEAATRNLLVTLNKFAIAKAINQASANQLTALSNQAKEFFNSTGVIADNSVLSVGAVEVKLTTDTVFDESAIIAEAEKLGLHLNDFVKKVTYNIEDIHAEIKKHNPNFNAASEVQSQSVVVTRKQKGTAADLKNLTVENADQLLTGVLSVAESTSDFESIEDKIDADIKQMRSKQAYYKGKWEEAIATFVNYTEKGNAESDIAELAGELLDEVGTQPIKTPF